MTRVSLFLPAALGLLFAGCGVQPLEQKDLDALRRPTTDPAGSPPTATTTAAHKGKTQQPKIIAKVGGVSIGFFRFRGLYANRLRLILRKGQVLMPGRKETLAKNVLDALIVLELWHQEALRRGMLATEAEVEQYLRRELLPKVGGERGLRNHLRRQGQTLQVFRADLKSKLGTTRLMQQISSQDVPPVTSDEIRVFFASNREKLRTQRRLRLAHMILPAKGSEAQALAAARKQAQEALNRIRKGEAFADVARQVSKCRSKSCRDRGGMAPPYTDPPDRKFLMAHPALSNGVRAVLPKLKPGQISNPVRTLQGYEIVYLRDRAGGKALTLAKASPLIKGLLRKGKVQKVLDAFVASLRKRAKIKVLVPLAHLVKVVDASMARRRGRRRGSRRRLPGRRGRRRGIPGGS